MLTVFVAASVTNMAVADERTAVVTTVEDVAGKQAAEVVATDMFPVVLLAGSGAFTFEEAEGVGSTEALAAVESPSVGFTSDSVNVTALAGDTGVVVISESLTGAEQDAERFDTEEACIDSVSRLGLLVETEVTWMESNFGAVVFTGKDSDSAVTEAEVKACVGAWSVLF